MNKSALRNKLTADLKDYCNELIHDADYIGYLCDYSAEEIRAILSFEVTSLIIEEKENATD